MIRNLIKLGLALTGLCAITHVYAHSAKALGMGDVGVAYPQDALSTIYNPANACEIGDRGDIVLGAQYDPYSAKLTGNPNPAANEHIFGRRTWAPYAAIGINKWFDCFAVNFTFSNRFFHKTHYNQPNVLAGTTRLGHGYEKYAASLAVAYHWRAHTLGLSADLLVGRHKAIGIQNFDSSIFSVAPGHVTNRGYDWNYGLGITLGWLWDVTDTLRVGATFRPETKMSRFHKYKGFIPSRGIIHNPQALALGLSYRFAPCATIAFDYWYTWTRRIRAVRNPTVVNPFIVLLGTKHGTSFGLRNMQFFKFGFDYALFDCLTLRWGWIYTPETNRRSQAFIDTIYNTPEENYITAGATFLYNCWEVDPFFVHGFERRIKGPIPAFEGGGTAWHKRSITVFGIGLGREF